MAAATTTIMTPGQAAVVLGWIGLGNMGVGMARNIQRYIGNGGSNSNSNSNKNGADASSSRQQQEEDAEEEEEAAFFAPQLRVYNRTASRCAAVEELGGVRCSSVAKVAGECDFIFLSLSDDAAVLSMVDQLITASTTASSPITGKIIIDTTTVHPDTTKKVTNILTSHGARFAAMPVFGPAPVAAAGQLIAAFAGPAEVLNIARPVLKGVIAREVMVVGEDPEKAVLLKTTSNLLTATITQAIAEAHVFASKTGLPASTLERLIELNLGPYAHLTSQRMTSGVYCPAPGSAPWSDLSLALKDVGHGVDTAEGRGVRLRAGRATLESLRMADKWAESEGAVGKGGGENGEEGKLKGKRRLDSSSLFGAIRVENGLDFETDFVKERDGKIDAKTGDV